MGGQGGVEISITVSGTTGQLSLTLNILRYARPLPFQRDRVTRGRGGARAAVTFDSKKTKKKSQLLTTQSVSPSIVFALWPRSGRNIADDTLTFTSPSLLSLDL